MINQFGIFYLAVGILLLAIAIVVYPTLRHRSQSN